MKTYSVDQDRWARLSIFEQMGNIYSEVGRSLNAKLRHDVRGCESATARALDLFDATVASLTQQKSIRAKEVLRSKDQFLHVVYDTEVNPQAIASLEQYFRNFAVAARRNR